MPGWWIGQDEHRQAAVLRHVPVGAGQAQAPVGPPGAGGPDLGAVEHPLVAVAHRRGEGAGDVGAAARLGEELHPELLALAGSPACGPASAPRCRTRAAPRRTATSSGPGRGTGTRSRRISSLNARWWAGVSPWPPYSFGKQMPAKPGVEELALQLALAGDRGQLLLVAALGPRARRCCPVGEDGWRLARMKARARCRNASTVSISLSTSALTPRPPALGEVRDPPAVLARRAVHGAVDDHPAQEQVQVVLEGDADAAVDLHAVLQQLGAVVADVGLGRAHQLAGVVGCPAATAAAPRR